MTSPSSSPTNPFTQLIDLIESTYGEDSSTYPIIIEIPMTIASDLMGMNRGQWLEVKGGISDESQIDSILDQFFTLGLKAIDGMHFRGISLKLANDSKITTIRRLDGGQ